MMTMSMMMRLRAYDDEDDENNDDEDNKLLTFSYISQDDLYRPTCTLCTADIPDIFIGDWSMLFNYYQQGFLYKNKCRY